MLNLAFGQIRDITTVSMQEVELRSMQHTNCTYLGSNLMLCKILTRYKMFVDSRDIGVAANILMDGFWESWITRFVVQHVQPGNICIDAGANFGYYSLIMAELAGHEGKTIAVEPNSYLCKLLAHTSSVNGYGFGIEKRALSDHRGEMTLMIPENFWGSASLYPGKIEKNMHQETVQVETLDGMVERLELPRVDFIKMDCEGAEPMIFAGMEKTLQQNPQIKIVMEFSPFIYKDATAFTDYLFSRFEVSAINNDASTKLFSENDKEKLVQLTDHIDLFLEVKRVYAPVEKEEIQEETPVQMQTEIVL